VNNSVLLRCWTHHGQELVEIAPVIRSASLFNGSQFVCDVDFKRTDGKSVGRLPTVYFHLPTHTLKLVDLRIDGSEFDTVVPLELRQN
jgi:hypothetical protein